MWLQVNLAREVMSTLVRREVDENPPEPVDVTSLLPVDVKVPGATAQMRFTVTDVDLAQLPWIDRPFTFQDGTTRELTGDNLGFVVEADMHVRLAVAGKQVWDKKVGRVLATYRLGARAELSGTVVLQPEFVDVDVTVVDPVGSSVESAARQRLSEKREPVTFDGNAALASALPVSTGKHKLWNVSASPRPCRNPKKAGEPDFVALTLEYSPVEKGSLFAFSHSGITKSWGDIGSGGNCSITLWSETVLALVEQFIREELPKKQVVLKGKIASRWENVNGSNGVGRFGVVSVFKATAVWEDQTVDLDIDLTIRFSMSGQDLLITVSPHIVAKVSAKDAVAGAFHWIGEQVGDFLTGDGDGGSSVSFDEAAKKIVVRIPMSFDTPLGTFTGSSISTRAWSPIKGGLGEGAPKKTADGKPVIKIGPQGGYLQVTGSFTLT